MLNKRARISIDKNCHDAAKAWRNEIGKLVLEATNDEVDKMRGASGNVDLDELKAAIMSRFYFFLGAELQESADIWMNEYERIRT